MQLDLLHNAIKRSTRDLGRQKTNRDRSAKIAADASAREQAKELERKVECTLAQEKERQAFEANTLLFRLDKKLHHRTLTFEDQKAWAAKQPGFSVPWIVKLPNWEELIEPSSTVGQALGRWSRQFENADPCKRENQVAAPVENSMGLRAASAALDRFMPALKLQPADPTFAKALSSISWWGFSKQLVFFSREPLGMASLRMQAAGETEVVMCSVRSLALYLAKRKHPQATSEVLQNKALQEITEVDIKAFLTNATQETLDAAGAEKDVDIYHAVVPPKSCIFMPAGFVSAVCVVNSAKSYGIRCPVLGAGCTQRVLDDLSFIASWKYLSGHADVQKKQDCAWALQARDLLKQHVAQDSASQQGSASQA